MANTQKILVKQTGAEKTAGSIKKVDRSIAGLTTSALAYTAAAGAILAIAKKTIDAYGIQEQAEKKLETALGGVNTALLEQASALQQVTVFGDEAIIGVQASIAAFTQSEEDIKKATEATLDFASAMGFDLKSAGELIAKTLGSSTNALTRYGVEVTGAVGSTERLTTLTEGISKLWGGQATAAADTMTGSMEQASNAVGDLAEGFGEFLAPAINSASTAIKGWAEALSELGEEDTLQDNIDIITKKLDKLKTGAGEQTWMTVLFDGMTGGSEKSKKAIEELETELNRLLELQKELAEPAGSGEEEIIILDDTVTALRAYRVELEEIALIDFSDSNANILTDFQKVEGQIDSFTRSMVTAAVEGQSMSDALISAAKGLTIELISEFIKRQLAAKFGNAATIAASTATAAAVGAAWATPAALAATATGGGSAVAGGIALAATVAEANVIAAFATGADFVTNGPQLIMVGDNHSGEEHVQVTPMGGDPNINGPSGGLVVNFYGPVTSRQFVRDDIIPEIKKAVRLNA